MPYQNRIRTPLLDKVAWDFVDRSLDYYLNTNAGASQVRLAMSLFAFEHGAGDDVKAPADGRALWNLWNWNFGNRRGAIGDRGQYFQVAEEIIDGKAKQIGGGWPAWSTQPLGLISWFQEMGETFPRSWDLIVAGTPDLMLLASTMKKEGYYTTSIKRYEAGLRTWYRIFQKRGW